MNRHISWTLAATALIGVALLVSPAAKAGIDGTDHDFELATWNSGDEICAPCHTPHGADLTVSDAPLWAHTLSTATYTTYTSDTIDATMGAPAGVSALCLSCHDGTISLDSFVNGGTNTTKITGGANLGTDMNSHHPVSFQYDATHADVTAGGLFNPTTTSSGIVGSSGNIDDDMLFGTAADQMECASCHDVHGGVAGTVLLRKSNTGSALCLTCHDK